MRDSARQTVVTANGDVLAVDKDNNRVNRYGGASGWEQIDSFVAAISVGAAGQLQIQHTPIGQKWRELGFVRRSLTGRQ